MFGQTLFQPNGRNVWAYLSSHGASDWHFKLMWRHTFVCFHTTVSQYHFRFCPGKAREGGLAGDWQRTKVDMCFYVEPLTGTEFWSCYYAAIWPMYLWCNWSPATGCNMDEWYCCTSPYNTLQFRIDSLCIIVPDPWLDLPKPLSRWADLLFRGFAPNVPQNLPQQSQCAVRWVLVLPRDIQACPNRISIDCHSIGKPTCCRRFVASRWWSLWGQYLQFYTGIKLLIVGEVSVLVFHVIDNTQNNFWTRELRFTDLKLLSSDFKSLVNRSEVWVSALQLDLARIPWYHWYPLHYTYHFDKIFWDSCHESWLQRIQWPQALV